jgi:hypothetical protein
MKTIRTYASILRTTLAASPGAHAADRRRPMTPRILSAIVTPLLVANALLALPAPGAAQTPTPVIQPGSPCPAVIQVSWDVSAIDGATRIRRRVRSDFSSGVLHATTIQQATGSETIDLRA